MVENCIKWTQRTKEKIVSPGPEEARGGGIIPEIVSPAPVGKSSKQFVSNIPHKFCIISS